MDLAVKVHQSVHVSACHPACPGKKMVIITPSICLCVCNLGSCSDDLPNMVNGQLTGIVPRMDPTLKCCQFKINFFGPERLVVGRWNSPEWMVTQKWYSWYFCHTHHIVPCFWLRVQNCCLSDSSIFHYHSSIIDYHLHVETKDYTESKICLGLKEWSLQALIMSRGWPPIWMPKNKGSRYRRRVKG